MTKPKWMAIASVALASAALGGTSLLQTMSPVASAATKAVSIVYPAGSLSTFDPLTWSSQILIDQGTTLEGLFGYNAKNQLEPKIAQSWEISDGGRVWTIQLRHNARWSNGQPVTAEDFYYAWMRMDSPSNTDGATWESVVNYVLNASQYKAGEVPASKVGIKVLNPYELKLTLTASVNIESWLAIAGSMPLYPPDVQKHSTNWWLPQYFVGDGPYILKSFETNGEDVLTRNPYYVGHSGETNVGNVSQINLIPEPTVPLEDYESGALDAAIITTPSDYKYALAHFPSQVHKTPEALVNYLGYDHSPDPSPLNSTLVREAIAMAINRAPIVDPVLNNMVGATSVFAYPGFPTYTLEHNPYGYNVATARKLLAKAGYPDGKGIGQLYLYTFTQTYSPQSISMAEAISAELKTNLNLNFKIEPMNTTEENTLMYEGIDPGILPGYSTDLGVSNWDSTVNWPLQSNQWEGFYGSIGPQAYRSHTAVWYLDAYDPRNVKAFGNPTDSHLGVTYATWQPLIKAAKADIASIDAWTARQPAAYRAALIIPGVPTLTQDLNLYLASYKTAKTAQIKHQDWEAFWKFVGTYSEGGGTISLGINGQAWNDQHEPALVANERMWTAELANTPSASQSAALAAKIADAMIQSGYVIPLNYGENVYVAKPNLSQVVANPWQMQYFYQLQYMTIH